MEHLNQRHHLHANFFDIMNTGINNIKPLESPVNFAQLLFCLLFPKLFVSYVPNSFRIPTYNLPSSGLQRFLFPVSPAFHLSEKAKGQDNLCTLNNQLCIGCAKSDCSSPSSDTHKKSGQYFLIDQLFPAGKI